MRVVFMGTPEFAVPALLALSSAGHDIQCVATQPDKPAGRGRRIASPPVKEAAEKLGYAVVQPRRVSTPEFIQSMQSLDPDVAVVAAFGQKIPGSLLAVPRHGFINVHPSLLPRYRGAAPIQRCLMNGDAETGVTIMYMDEGWDTGDMGLVQRVAIPAHADAGEMSRMLAQAGGELLVRFLRLLEERRAPRKAQDHGLATYAPKISPEDEEIDWTRGAREIVNRIRALSPQPGARTSLDGQLLRVLRASVVDSPAGANCLSGQVIVGPRCELIIRCGRSGAEAVAMDEVQPAGKRCMKASEFARGRRISSGALLGYGSSN
ncbi:MAG: methionyl-tRNA formyltransferase [Clostridia bacterium]|nr:methionyl-tRNA formyltransferase [Clostridia bacterium]